MAVNYYHIFVCFTGIIAFASSQNITENISCYECNPRIYGSDCGDPVANNVRDVTCQVFGNGTPICISTFLQYTGDKANQTGIYRGCKTLLSDVRNFCDWYIEENRGSNLTIPTCISCNSTRCNLVKLNADGTGAASSSSAAIFVLALNAIFIMLINLWG